MFEPDRQRAVLEEHFHAQERRPGRRRSRQPRLRMSSWVPVLLVLALLGGGAYYGVNRGVDYMRDLFADPADFSGPGHGQILFEVVSGQSIGQIGENLEEEGVVASSEAFVDEASAEPLAVGIQAGFYELRREMPATDALAVLVDPDKVVTNAVTVPEGLPIRDIGKVLGKKTDFEARQFARILENPQGLGLPAYANGNTEGYLFPATYAFAPKAKPRDMLREMVDRWRQAASDAGLEAGAKRLGYTPHEVMTVASLVEAEARGDDMPKVARVIYNRIEHPDRAGARLQLDATVNYAHGRDLGARTTSSDRKVDSPYNTYRSEGLPPGPIEAPGDAAISAALKPAEGDWVFYVTVNLATGETKFAETEEEHARNKAELDEYCRTQSDRC